MLHVVVWKWSSLTHKGLFTPIMLTITIIILASTLSGIHSSHLHLPQQQKLHPPDHHHLISNTCSQLPHPIYSQYLQGLSGLPFTSLCQPQASDRFPGLSSLLCDFKGLYPHDLKGLTCHHWHCFLFFPLTLFNEPLLRFTYLCLQSHLYKCDTHQQTVMFCLL